MDRQSTSYKKKWKISTVAALVVLIIVTISGCTDKKPEDIQKGVNTHIYVDMGQEGDPEKQIHEFYDIALQEAGDPVVKPLAQYAAEYELDPETGHVIPETIKIYDPDGNPLDRETALAMQGNIATDDTGNIITDAALLDIHIEEIGKNKYQIKNLAQEMQVEDGVWRVKPRENPSFDKKLIDNEINVGDNKDEFAPGLVRGDDGNIYGVIIADEDVFDIYYGDFGIKAKGVNPIGIDKGDCIDLGGGLYAYVYNLSEAPGDSVSVHSPYLLSQEAHIKKEHGGKFAQFSLKKETI
jgi:hypothetical protein